MRSSWQPTSAAGRPRAVEVVGDAAGGDEHVELRGEGLEHELDSGGSVRARRGPSGAPARVTARDARLDALEVPGGRARAPDLARRSSFMLCEGVGLGVLGANDGGGGAAGGGEDAAGLLAVDERGDGLEEVGHGEEAHERRGRRHLHADDRWIAAIPEYANTPEHRRDFSKLRRKHQNLQETPREIQ
jgi:hypothetical protein